jgi:AraC-like DNA-binding protein
MPDYNKFLSPTELDEKWGFYVTTVGYSKTLPNQQYPRNNEYPASHAFNWNKGRILNAYYIVFISKGSGVFESSYTAAKKIEQGVCFFLFPDVWHRYKPDPANGWEEYWIGLNGSFVKSLHSNGFLNPKVPFTDTGSSGIILNLFQQLIEAVKSSEPGYQQIISGIAHQILGLLYAIEKNKQVGENEEIQLVEKTKFLMTENIEKQMEVSDLIVSLSLNYSAFKKKFKNQTGISPTQYYLNLKLKKAVELMTFTTLSFKEIAYKTGFKSQFYFSRFFKKKYGDSPKSYRQKLKL